MIKTIKVKKQLRLDELIKYVRDNGVNGQAFVDDAGRASVYFGSEQRISFGEYAYGDFGIDRTFTVEVEEEINKRHKFRQLTTIFKKNDDDKVRAGLLHNSSIYDVLVGYGGSKVIKIYALVGTTLELIWEAD